MTISWSKQYTEDYCSFSFYSQNSRGEWLIVILLLVVLQCKLGGWVIDIYFIIIFVILNNKRYIFWYFILNVWVLYGSMLCQIVEQLQPKMGNVLEICFCLSLFFLVLCVSVHENHKHVQCWNPNTKTSLPGRHNNDNNKHGEKPNNKLGGKEFLVRIQPWICLWFSWTERYEINKIERNNKVVLIGRTPCQLIE